MITAYLTVGSGRARGLSSVRLPFVVGRSSLAKVLCSQTLTLTLTLTITITITLALPLTLTLAFATIDFGYSGPWLRWTFALAD